MVDAAIERFELGDLAGRRADRLSMGQRQRVRLALITLHEPRVLLLDEAANSLDDEGVALLLHVVEETREAGGCVIWCAPKIDESELRVDRRLTLQGGRLA
jgi:ABC-type multidrug transport system ATPase subunit